MQPTEDERVFAALAHASIIANVANLSGLLAASLIWATQREKSAYVRAQALQALAYQGCVVVLSVLLVLGWAACLALSLLPAALRPELYRSSPPALFWVALYGAALPLFFSIIAVLVGLYAAGQALRGHAFRYPLFGRLAQPRSQTIPPVASTAPPVTSSEPQDVPPPDAPPSDPPPA